MLTAKDSELDKVVGLELGADDYVTKPFSLRERQRADPGLFRRSEASVAAEETPAIIDLGRVQADLAGHRLLRDGETLPVKPKAFELLAFLIRHPGQVFTRDQLLEQVWGYDYGGETRTVDVHVHWLRSQVEDDPGQPRYIHTVRGVGYVFRRPPDVRRRFTRRRPAVRGGLRARSPCGTSARWPRPRPRPHRSSSRARGRGRAT